MSFQQKRSPELNIEIFLSPVEDFSPRSEDFHEEISNKYPILIAPLPASNIANLPNATALSQEKKNPLMSKQIDYNLLLKTQEQELIALNTINQKLKVKLIDLQKEFNTVKDIPSLIIETDKKVKSLEISLDLAKEELKMIDETNKGRIPKKNCMFAFEYYSLNRPRRVWTVEKEVLRLDNLRSDILSRLFKSRSEIL